MYINIGCRGVKKARPNLTPPYPKISGILGSGLSTLRVGVQGVFVGFRLEPYPEQNTRLSVCPLHFPVSIFSTTKTTISVEAPFPTKKEAALSNLDERERGVKENKVSEQQNKFGGSRDGLTIYLSLSLHLSSFAWFGVLQSVEFTCLTFLIIIFSISTKAMVIWSTTHSHCKHRVSQHGGIFVRTAHIIQYYFSNHKLGRSFSFFLFFLCSLLFFFKF